MIRFADPQGVHSYAWSLGRQNSEQLEHDRCFKRHFFVSIAFFLHILALVIITIFAYWISTGVSGMYFSKCVRYAYRFDSIWYIYIYMCVCFYLRVHFYKHIFWMRMVKSEASGHKQRQAIWAPLIKMRLVTSPLCYLPFHVCCWRHLP